MPGLAASIDFLDQHVVADVRVRTKVAAVAIGDGGLERASLPAPQLVQVEGVAERPLVGVARQSFGAAADVARHLTAVREVEGDATIRKASAQTAPVAQEV